MHKSNFEYTTQVSLRQLVEDKINSSNSSIFLMPVLARNSYYCFRLQLFSYDLLDELKDKTFAIDFILLLPQKSGGFIFFEDDPVCYMFFKTRADFEEGFMSPERAMELFGRQMNKWLEYKSEDIIAWLQKVDHALRSKEVVAEDE